MTTDPFYEPVVPNPGSDLQFPVRYRWLGRLARGCGAGTLLVAVLWAAWNFEASRRLSARLADVRSRGGLTSVDQLASPPVPEGSNAADLYLRAGTLVDEQHPGPRMWPSTFRNFPPFPREWHALAAASAKANAPALSLVRRARGLSGVDWHVAARSPLMTTLRPTFECRMLASIAADAALYARSLDDDAEALETSRDTLAMAKRVSQMSPANAYVYLSAADIHDVAVESLEVLSGGLRIEGSPVPAGVKPASRAAVSEVVRTLMDDAQAPDAEGALDGQRLEDVDVVYALGRDGWMLRPMFRLDDVRTLDLYAPLFEALAEPTIAGAKSRLPGRWEEPADWTRTGGKRPADRLVTYLGDLFRQTEPRLVKRHFQLLAERRLAAACLAAQWFRADHGAWPASLDALVPAYLPAVPRDPYADGDRPLGYAVLVGPTGRPRPLVVSGAPGGDVARAGQPPPEPQFVWHPETGAQWRDISRWEPVTAASP